MERTLVAKPDQTLHYTPSHGCKQRTADRCSDATEAGLATRQYSRMMLRLTGPESVATEQVYLVC